MNGSLKYMLALGIMYFVLVTPKMYAHEGHEQKIRYYSERISEEPSNPDNYFFRGIQYQSHHFFEDARRDFLHVLELQPDHVNVNYQLAWLYLENEQSDSALIYVNTFIDYLPDNEKAYLCRADIYNRNKQYDKARIDYEKAISFSDNPGIELFFALSKNYKDAGQADLAKQALDSAIESLGNIIPVREAAIELCMEMGSWDEAHRILDSIIEDVQRKEVWYLMKAEIFEAESKFDEAQIYYQEALSAIQSLNSNYRNKLSVRTMEQNIMDKLKTPK